MQTNWHLSIRKPTAKYGALMRIYFIADYNPEIVINFIKSIPEMESHTFDCADFVRPLEVLFSLTDSDLHFDCVVVDLSTSSLLRINLQAGESLSLDAHNREGLILSFTSAISLICQHVGLVILVEPRDEFPSLAAQVSLFPHLVILTLSYRMRFIEFARISPVRRIFFTTSHLMFSTR